MRGEKKDFLVFVKHIRDSISEIESFTRNVSKEQFMQNKLIQNAVIRSLEVIGEAVKNLPIYFKKDYSEIPWGKIAGMRDKIIHHYFGVDLGAIWKVVKENVPVLKKQINEILEKEDSSSK
jgi:uncharacterized protein with HEPN domain